MKILTILFLVALTVIGLGQSLGKNQQAAAAVNPPNLPFPRTDQPRAASPFFGMHPFITATTGTITETITITIKSTALSSDAISCQGSASTFESSGLTFTDLATVAATPSTGLTRHCTVTIPFSWEAATPTIDRLLISYSITAPTSAAALPNRFANHGALVTTGVKSESLTLSTVI